MKNKKICKFKKKNICKVMKNIQMYFDNLNKIKSDLLN